MSWSLGFSGLLRLATARFSALAMTVKIKIDLLVFRLYNFYESKIQIIEGKL